MPGDSKYEVEWVDKPEFLHPVLQRTWHRVGDDFLLLKEELERKRSLSGFGLLDPYAIYLTHGQIVSCTSADVETLAEKQVRQFGSKNSWWIREIGEQICFGLHRIHIGLKQPHGALLPYNVCLDTEEKVALWSVPTAQLERKYSSAEDDHEMWDLLYTAPEQDRKQPTVSGDVFSLGAILQKLSEVNPKPRGSLVVEPENSLEDLPGDQMSALRKDIRRALFREPEKRFQSALEFAKVLNPETRLAGLDLELAIGYQRLGIEKFRLGEVSLAAEFFKDGLRHDWLSVGLWNNSAVVKMHQADWKASLEDLQKARRLSQNHPKVLINLGYCFLAMGDRGSAENLLNQAQAMHTSAATKNLLAAFLSLLTGEPDAALYQAREAVIENPTSISAKAYLTAVLAQRGDPIPEELANLNFPETALFSDFLIDDGIEPPWGKIIRGGPPNNDDDDLGSGVPRVPRSPAPVRKARLKLEQEL